MGKLKAKENKAKARSRKLLKKYAKDPNFRYASGAVNCSEIAVAVAEELQIPLHDNHWMYDLAVRVAYESS